MGILLLMHRTVEVVEVNPLVLGEEATGRVGPVVPVSEKGEKKCATSASTGTDYRAWHSRFVRAKLQNVDSENVY